MAPFPCIGSTLVAALDYESPGCGYLGVSAGDPLKVLHIGCGDNASWFYASKLENPDESGWLPVRQFLPARPTAQHRLAGGPEAHAPAEVSAPIEGAAPVEAAVPVAAQAPETAAPAEVSEPAPAEGLPEETAPSAGKGPRELTCGSTVCAFRDVAWPDSSGKGVGYLAPIKQGEELAIMWVDDGSSPENEGWIYARRTGPPRDQGWVLKEVVTGNLMDELKQARVLKPGEMVFHLHPRGLRGCLQVSPGETVPTTDSRGLEHNEMVRVLEVAGTWVHVEAQDGGNGWVCGAHLRSAPLPPDPPPTGRAAAAEAPRSQSRASSCSSRRRVSFDDGPVIVPTSPPRPKDSMSSFQ